MQSAQLKSAMLTGSIDLISSPNYVTITPSTVPYDVFTGFPRLPGFLDYGIDLAVPFSSPTLTLSFNATSYLGNLAFEKVTLGASDRLVVNIPSTDTDDDNVPGTFNVIATSGTTGGTAQTTTALQPGQSFVVTAGATGEYLVEIAWQPPSGTNSLTARFQFQVLPGPTIALYSS